MLQYRKLYPSCHHLLEEYSKSSIQAGDMSGLASAGKLLGKAVSKVPVIGNSQLDENLLDAGDQLKKYCDRQAEKKSKAPTPTISASANAAFAPWTVDTTTFGGLERLSYFSFPSFLRKEPRQLFGIRYFC